MTRPYDTSQSVYYLEDDEPVDFYRIRRPGDKEKRSNNSSIIRRRPRTAEKPDTSFQLELPPMSKTMGRKNKSLPTSAKRSSPFSKSHLVQIRSPNKTYLVSDGKSIMVTQLRAPIIPTDNNENKVERQTKPEKQEKRDEDTDWDSLLEDFIKTHKLEDESKAYNLSKHAKVKLAKAIDEDDYQRGEELHKAIRLLNKIAFPAAHPLPIITNNERIASANKEIDELNQKHDERLEKYENHRKQLNDQRRSRQESEIEGLTNHLGTNKFLMPFQKPSGVLLNEKKKQKFSAKLGDFESAKQLKTITERMMQNEAEDAKSRALHRAEEMHTFLIEKHVKEDYCAEMNDERKRLALEMDREAEINPIKRRIEQLERGVHPPLYVF